MQIEIIPTLKDNYTYLIHDQLENVTACIDAGEAEPVLVRLQELNLKLDQIISTHHHWDHVNGNVKLHEVTGAPIYAYVGDKDRVAGASVFLEENKKYKIGSLEYKVLFIPGHTLGHIALWFEKEKIVFTGDTLFLSGCGRLFEGTYEQMYASLAKLSSLPEDTFIYCGHEYTLQNLNFAKTIEPENKDIDAAIVAAQKVREKNLPTVPSTIKEQLKLNPFLRTNELLNNNSFENLDNIDIFKKIRELKNNY